MKKIVFAIITSLFLSVSLFAQTDTTKTTTETKTETKRVYFRATKDQITQAQKMLKVTESGKMDADTKAAVKKYQSENGLKQTGSLNRATLEKLGIELTDKQKTIPVDPNSYASTDDKTTTKKRGPIFRATKDQIIAAQKMLKEKGLYTGEATGKLDPATRTGLKAYQEANGLKSTGTLNQLTLEKMGIPLTDKQKENAAMNSQ